MKKIFLNALKIAVGLYLLLCVLLYFFQEKFIFHPQKLDKNFQFVSEQKFEELNIPSTDGKLINGLLFKADSSKGLIFYLHGNAGSLSGWVGAAKTYTDLNYDVFLFDYRGFGKSEGQINGQEQLFQDNQVVYDELKKRYAENKIVVLGYSIGTGLAAKLASINHPRLLILEAPYYNLTDMMKRNFSFVPTFLLRYKFATNEYIKDCKMPVVIFHGDQDEVINYDFSLKLEREFKPIDTLITLNGQGHDGIMNNRDYKMEIVKILAR